MRRGRADVDVGGISMTSEREEYLDFSHPFCKSGLRIAISMKALLSESRYRKRINQALLEIFEDGTYAALCEKWLGAAPH